MRLPRCLPLTFCLSLCACATAPRGSAATSWGSTMSEVGRRFELIGLATHAGRLELAAYELGEIDELFTDTLPGASLPKEGHPEVLGSLRTTFATQGFSGLKRALAAGDQAKARSAPPRASATPATSPPGTCSSRCRWSPASGCRASIGR